MKTSSLQCFVTDCNNLRANRGHGKRHRCFCEKHFYQNQQGLIEKPPPLPKRCIVSGCENTTPFGGKCSYHKELLQQEREEKQRLQQAMRQSKLEAKVAKSAKRKRKERAIARRLQPCWLCGWNEDRCDTHRIVPGEAGGTYRTGNIINLCPNCHRIVTSNPLRISDKVCSGVLNGMPITDHLLEVCDSIAALWKLTKARQQPPINLGSISTNQFDQFA